MPVIIAAINTCSVRLFIKKFPQLNASAVWRVYLPASITPSFPLSILPGCKNHAIKMPIDKARVVTTSKYINALTPTPAYFFKSPMLLMPKTIVRKIMGAINTLMMLINVLPITSIFTAVAGKNDLIVCLQQCQ
ncbi:MAG: hypothetical protein WKF59_14365 [Chitinophagaceae bacterium]